MLDACTVYKISTRGMLANTACSYTMCSSPKHVEMKLSFIITTHQSFTDQKGRETVRKGGAGAGQEVGGGERNQELDNSSSSSSSSGGGGCGGLTC